MIGVWIIGVSLVCNCHMLIRFMKKDINTWQIYWKAGFKQAHILTNALIIASSPQWPIIMQLPSKVLPCVTSLRYFNTATHCNAQGKTTIQWMHPILVTSFRNQRDIMRWRLLSKWTRLGLLYMLFLVIGYSSSKSRLTFFGESVIHPVLPWCLLKIVSWNLQCIRLRNPHRYMKHVNKD